MESNFGSFLPGLSHAELHFLEDAANYLERPSFLIRIGNMAGKPVEAILKTMPGRAQTLVADLTTRALRTALEWAVRSLPRPLADEGQARLVRQVESRFNDYLHTAVAATTGAVGGFFGLTGVAVELPATTTIMLRSIARIAAGYGADLSEPSVRLQCLSVFSYGSPSLEAMDSAYLTSRIGVGWAVKDATTFIASRSACEVSDALTRGTLPVLVRLLNQIASRFEVVVSQKLAAQALPVAGAATGAVINAAFTEHFNTVARYHFGIVQLERHYGRQAVQHAYQVAQAQRTAREGRRKRSA